MRLHLDLERCEGHGLCAGIAPDVFDLDDDARVVLLIDPEVPVALQQAAADAVHSCPVAALRADP